MEALAALASGPLDRPTRAALSALVRGGLVERVTELACALEYPLDSPRDYPVLPTGGHPRVQAAVHILHAVTLGDDVPAETLIRTRKCPCARPPARFPF